MVYLKFLNEIVFNLNFNVCEDYKLYCIERVLIIKNWIEVLEKKNRVNNV